MCVTAVAGKKLKSAWVREKDGERKAEVEMDRERERERESPPRAPANLYPSCFILKYCRFSKFKHLAVILTFWFIPPPYFRLGLILSSLPRAFFLSFRPPSSPTALPFSFSPPSPARITVPSILSFICLRCGGSTLFPFCAELSPFFPSTLFSLLGSLILLRQLLNPVEIPDARLSSSPCSFYSFCWVSSSKVSSC